MKQTVYLTESQLRSMIEESVKQLVAEGEVDELSFKGLSNIGKRIGNSVKNAAQGAWQAGKTAAQNAVTAVGDAYDTTKEKVNQYGQQLKKDYQMGAASEEHAKIAKQLQQWNEQGVFGSPRAKSLVSQLINLLNKNYEGQFGTAGQTENPYAKK